FLRRRRILCRRRKDPPRGRKLCRDVQGRLGSLALRYVGRGGRCPGSLCVPLANESRKLFHAGQEGGELGKREGVRTDRESTHGVILCFHRQTIYTHATCR